LKEEVAKHRDRDNLLIMFTDSYDVVLTSPPAEVVRQFAQCRCSVLFSAEDSCWPDASLAAQYPPTPLGYRYLNSGGFVGKASTLAAMMEWLPPASDASDDQLLYTRLFLDPAARERFGLKLDHLAKVFQNLNHNAADVQLKFLEDDTRLVNSVYQTRPIVVHGNGPSKTLLASLGNYLAKSWVEGQGCLGCAEDVRTLDEEALPVVVVAVFIERATPFLEEMLKKVAALRYPKSRLHLYLHCQVERQWAVVEAFLAAVEGQYSSTVVIAPGENLKEWHARNGAVKHCLSLQCDALFSVESEVHLDNRDTLRLLLRQNRTILGAVMVQPGRAWSTFWGAVTAEGYYARSTDYMAIVDGGRRGVWAVPHITGVYLIRGDALTHPSRRPSYIRRLLDPDMAMAANYRARDVLMYTSNLHHYGHLVDSANYPDDKLYPDLWQMHNNKQDWEEKYLHPDYFSQAVNMSYLNPMPCPDVYWFPLFSETFCHQLIATMEHNGGWSGSSTKDERIPGGYENVPTDDIHMTQIGFQQEGNHLIKSYVRPLAEKVFLGYSGNGHADLIFVVRYTPEMQSFLRPHHDSSTYTINVGLNRPHVDYEGGGARFIRHNCSVTNTRMGWALLHPGRLTHYHEGLRTTRGKRYILVAFIDP